MVEATAFMVEALRALEHDSHSDRSAATVLLQFDDSDKSLTHLASVAVGAGARAHFRLPELQEEHGPVEATAETTAVTEELVRSKLSAPRPLLRLAKKADAAESEHRTEEHNEGAAAHHSGRCNSDTSAPSSATDSTGKVPRPTYAPASSTELKKQDEDASLKKSAAKRNSTRPSDGFYSSDDDMGEGLFD